MVLKFDVVDAGKMGKSQVDNKKVPNKNNVFETSTVCYVCFCPIIPLKLT